MIDFVWYASWSGDSGYSMVFYFTDAPFVTGELLTASVGLEGLLHWVAAMPTAIANETEHTKRFDDNSVGIPYIYLLLFELLVFEISNSGGF